MIGEILGNRYKILRDIGSGGMAWVYLAEDDHDGSLVAVKVLYPQFSEDMAYVQRFTREAKLASALSDPRIVRVLDYGATRDIHYLVMEHIEGRDLKEIIQERGTLPYRQVLEIAAQVAKALQHANEFGIVHRDIKPQNLMITAEGTVKVLDFGIARAGALPSLTQSGFVGSPYYISPEQAMGEEVDVRSDIYSLGVVMYEMLSGEVPFEAKSPWSIISQHIASEPPPLSLKDSGLPELVEQLVNRMLAKLPEDRFQTPEELLEIIESLLVEEKLLEKESTSSPQPDLDNLVDIIYQQAVEASQAEDWQKAVGFFKRILKLEPGYKDATERLAKAEQQVHLETLYSAARWNLEDKRWREAIDQLSRIVASDADYRDAALLLTETSAALPGTKKEVVAETRTQEKYPRPVPAVPGWIEANGRALGIGLLVLMVLLLLGGGAYAYRRYSEINAQEALEASYQRALDYMEQEQWDQALEEFDHLLAIAPGYEDAAQKREEVRQKRDQTAGKQQLDYLYAEGKEYYDQGQWDEALSRLEEVRTRDPTFQQAAVEEMLCRAYLEQGKAQVKALDDKNEEQELEEAIIAFGRGLDICPEEKSLREEMGLVLLYQEALELYARSKWAEVITKLKAVYETRPDYGGEQVARRLYRAYVERGDVYRQQGELVLALEDYQAALGLKEVEDRSAAQERRDSVLALLGTPTSTTRPTSTPTPTLEVSPTPTRIFKYRPPTLSSPPNGALLVIGEFAEVYLEWEPVAGLAENEFYNVTVLHFYNGEEVYWGDATRETKIRFPPEAGYGQSDKDLFHWWVEVRRTKWIKKDGRPDGPPISPKSEAWTFAWR